MATTAQMDLIRKTLAKIVVKPKKDKKDAKKLPEAPLLGCSKYLAQLTAVEVQV